MKKAFRFILWAAVAATGAYGLGLIAFARGEHRPSVLWFIVAALCIYATLVWLVAHTVRLVARLIRRFFHRGGPDAWRRAGLRRTQIELV